MVKKFSEVSKESGNCGRIVKKFWNFVKSISGDDSEALMKYILMCTIPGKNIVKKLDLIKFNTLLEETRLLHENTSQKRKYSVIAPLAISKHVTNKDLKENHKFKIGNTQYTTARKFYKATTSRTKPVVLSKLSKINEEEVESEQPLSRKHKPKLNDKGEELHCYCNQPNDHTAYIQCDTCEGWFHLSCVGLTNETVPKDDPFFCKDCNLSSKVNRSFTSRPVDLTLDNNISISEAISQAQQLPASPIKVPDFGSPSKLTPLSPFRILDYDSPYKNPHKKRKLNTTDSLKITTSSQKDSKKKKKKIVKTKSKQKIKPKAPSIKAKKLTPQKPKIVKPPIGFLRNGTMSCYMLSTYQSLMYCGILKDVRFASTPVEKEFCTYLQQRASKSKKAVEPTKLNNLICKSSEFRINEQNDASAFLQHLISHNYKTIVTDDSEKNLQPNLNRTYLGERTGFTLLCEITCKNNSCRYYSTKEEQDCVLQLSFETGKNLSIPELYEIWSSNDRLPDAYCDYASCKDKKIEHQQKFSISGFPAFLVVQLKRFDSNLQKDKNPVKIEETITLDDEFYELQSIIYHNGYDMRSGHYISAVKKSNYWYSIDDDEVKLFANFDQVSTRVSNDAYVLIYKRHVSLNFNKVPQQSTTENKITLFEKEKFIVDQLKFNFDGNENIRLENLLGKDNLYSLTIEEETNKMKDIFNQNDVPKKILFSNITIVADPMGYKKDFDKLFGNKFFGDWIMDYFGSILQNQYNKLWDGERKTRIHSTQFIVSPSYPFNDIISTPQQERQQKKYAIASDLQEIMVQNKNNTIFFPLNVSHSPNLDKNHWILVYVNSTGIHVVDSMGDSYEDNLVVMKLVTHLRMLMYKIDAKKELKVDYQESGQAQQQDGYNCGPFVLYYIHALLQGYDFQNEIYKLDSASITLYRTYIAEVICSDNDLVEKTRKIVSDVKDLKSKGMLKGKSVFYPSNLDGGGTMEIDEEFEKNYAETYEQENINTTSSDESVAMEIVEQNYAEKSYNLGNLTENPFKNINTSEVILDAMDNFVSDKYTSHIGVGKILNKPKLLVSNKYICPYQNKKNPNEPCAYSTSNRSNLHRHINGTHLEKKTHNCNQCSKSFSQSGNLKTHKRIIHGNPDAILESEKKTETLGRPNIDKKIILDINIFLSKNSQKSTKTIYVPEDKEYQPVLILSNSLNYLHKIYLAEGNTKVSLNTFMKYKSVVFKEGKKRTDLCGLCEKLKYLEQNLPLVEDEEQRKLMQAQIQHISVHKQRKNSQNEKFQETKKNLKEGQTIILQDFKQNVKLGPSSDEITKIFYKAKQRTIFSFIVYWNKKGSIENKKFIFVSEVLTHEGTFVLQAYRMLLNSQEFKSMNIKDLHVWSDGCKHFKNFQLLRLFHDLRHLKKDPFDKVELSFFIEYHCKNECDGLFGSVSKCLADYEKTHSQPIPNTQALIQVLDENLNKISSNDVPNVFVWELGIYERPPIIYQISLKKANLKKHKDQKRKFKKDPKKFRRVTFSQCYNFKFKVSQIHGRIINDDDSYVTYTVERKSLEKEYKTPLKVMSEEPPKVSNVAVLNQKGSLKTEEKRSLISKFSTPDEAIAILQKQIIDSDTIQNTYNQITEAEPFAEEKEEEEEEIKKARKKQEEEEIGMWSSAKVQEPEFDSSLPDTNSTPPGSQQ